MQFSRFFLLLTFAGILVIGCSTKLSEMEYYNLATEAFNKEDYQKSLENFKHIVDYYPEGQKSSEALFMLGYINANNTKNLKDAEKYYKQFIEKYPDDELTDDAQYELKHLGKDINDLPIFQDIPSDSAAGQTPSK